MPPKSECSSLTSRCVACGVFQTFTAERLAGALRAMYDAKWEFRLGVGWLCGECGAALPVRHTVDEGAMWRERE